MRLDTDNKGRLIILDIDENTLSLDKTLDCGETFRWYKLSSNIWQGIVGNQVWMLKQDKKENTIHTNLNFEDKAKLLEYFDLNTDYNIEINKLNLNDDNFALESINCGKGIRILKQDLWETMVSFIISQRNNIPKIKKSIVKLCDVAGSSAEVPNPEKFGMPYLYRSESLMMFPTPEQIVKHQKEIRENCSLGYRADYIIKLARDISLFNQRYVSKTYTEILKTLPSNKQMEVLLKIHGVGPKVANCIMLFGLHRLENFPIDVWVERISNTYYKGNINPKKYGKYSGLIQQYMFYNIRNNKI